ncbi:MAG: hypothetical protein ACTSXO_09225 [Candidatus Heimdallarchaeota archaeon]|nr:MAG: hypothetical protein DRO63_05810 [Candidatus Gerdarchaeota archaeon]RLI68457.1 MAG: hypothetical protein DRO91_09035 [Candidatus Heimdallarchaeota archaeon]RLI72396.1 MAG: hypothetical protein DRP02_01935 [Candidatus Gerdarchaeota archaeon]
MPTFGSKKRKISCKFCQEKAEYIKIYDDYFCSSCSRFQTETKTAERKLVPVLKLSDYKFTAQKFNYIVYNKLGSRIASIEKRDLSKYLGKKAFPIRFVFLNDINRIIGSVDSRKENALKSADALWQVYDLGRNLRGEIRFTVANNSWEIQDYEGALLGTQKSTDSSKSLQLLRTLTVVNPSNVEEILFSITRKGGFILNISSSTIDPYLAWAMVVCWHRRLLL